MQRRTSSEDVFDKLHADIVSLKLTPGTRLSEVDVARQFDVSRQPVREAFIRLHDIELLRVQPQRATEVRRLSEQALRNARFIRTAVEIEVIRVACQRDTARYAQAFEKNLEDQAEAIERKRISHFHRLDYAFHRMICVAAKHEFAYETVASNKSQLDRMCLLSLTDTDEMKQIHDDHTALYNHIGAGREEHAIALVRRHLSRVIDLLDAVRSKHPSFFTD